MKIESLVGQTIYALRDMVSARVAEVILEDLVASNKITRQDALKLMGKVNAQLYPLFDGTMTDIQRSIAVASE